MWSVNSKQTQITDTVPWFLENIELPGASAHDLFLAAIHDLTASLHALTRPTPLMHSTQPSHQLSQTITKGLLKLAAMYQSDRSSNSTVDDALFPDLATE